MGLGTVFRCESETEEGLKIASSMWLISGHYYAGNNVPRYFRSPYQNRGYHLISGEIRERNEKALISKQ